MRHSPGEGRRNYTLDNICRRYAETLPRWAPVNQESQYKRERGRGGLKRADH
jgi:hypothetical protein